MGNYQFQLIPKLGREFFFSILFSLIITILLVLVKEYTMLWLPFLVVFVGVVVSKVRGRTILVEDNYCKFFANSSIEYEIKVSDINQIIDYTPQKYQRDDIRKSWVIFIDHDGNKKKYRKLHFSHRYDDFCEIVESINPSIMFKKEIGRGMGKKN